MGRTTQAELTAVFGALVEQRRRVGLDVRGWELSRWAPGDGHAYWRIESDGGSRHPMGARQRSASELVDAMRFALNTLSELPEPVASSVRYGYTCGQCGGEVILDREGIGALAVDAACSICATKTSVTA